MFKHELSVSLDDMQRKQVFLVRRNDASMRLVHKLAGNCKPGAIIPLEPDEYDALCNDVTVIDLLEESKG